MNNKIFDYSTPIIGILFIIGFFLIGFLLTKKIKLKILKYFLFSVIFFGLLFYFIYNLTPKTTYIDIEMGLEKPIKIVQLTDFHCNTTYSQIINYSINLTNKENPDIVVYTGDFITTLTGENPHDSIYKYFKKIKCNKIYAVLGNHDLFQNPKKVKEKFEKVNIDFVDGKFIKIDEKTLLTGIDFKYIYFRDLRKSFKSLPKDKNIIYLIHTPKFLFQDYYNPNLIKDKKIFFITGHTHGGQSIFPWTNKKALAQERIYCDKLDGMTECEGNKVWISKGIGTGYFPIRWNARPEICVFNIK